MGQAYCIKVFYNCLAQKRTVKNTVYSGNKIINQLNQNNMELNKKVIIRVENVGVFYGTLVRKDRDEVELMNCRQLLFWNGTATLLDVARSGVKMDGNKFSVVVESMVIFGVNEIVACSEEAIKSIESVSEWKA